MPSSTFWKSHFETNLAKQRIDWSLLPNITKAEIEAISYSLKVWQLGETSDGKTLTALCEKHALKTNDPDFLISMQLFIKEEQKHGANLGQYIDLIGLPRLRKNWGDTFFRFLRHLNNNLESFTIVVVVAEYAAQVFYQALHDATNCDLLKSISIDILKDEAHHIKFQNQRLLTFFKEKSVYAKAFAVTWYCLFFFGTIHAIWLDHNKALKAGGMNKREFFRMMYQKFFKTISFLHQKEESFQTRLEVA
jgi:hypothetical protein